jgi:tetratricopeptide (TPR) repeat protein
MEEKWRKNYDKAEEYWGEGDEYQNCIKYATKAIEEGCKEINLYENLALSYLESKMYQECIVAVGIILKMDKDNYTMRGARADCYNHLGQIENEFKDYDYMIKDRPFDEENYSHRGICLSKLGKHKRAIYDLDVAEKAGSIGINGYLHRGISHLALGKIKNVKTDVEKYMEKVDERYKIFNRINSNNTFEHDYSDVIALLSKAIDLYKNDVELYTLRIDCYKRNNQQKEADSDSKQLHKLYPHAE